VDAVGKPGGATLSEVFTELVFKVKTDVVLIIDEVQHAWGRRMETTCCSP
jgi:4-aminobutyrate aminotransferase-like enzyme